MCELTQLTSVALLSLVAACGGGGGTEASSSAAKQPTVTAVITPENYQAISKEALAAVFSSSDQAANKAGAGANATQKSNLHMVAKAMIAGVSASKAGVNASADDQPASSTSNCGVSGTSRLDYSSSEEYSSVVKFTFNNCVETEQQEGAMGAVTLTRTGSFTIYGKVLPETETTINSTSYAEFNNLKIVYATGDEYNQNGKIKLTLSMQKNAMLNATINFALENLIASSRVAGVANTSNIKSSNTKLIISEDDLYAEAGYGYKSEEATTAVISSTKFSGKTYTYENIVPFVTRGNEPYPRSGVMTIKGATGVIRITAKTKDTFELALDADEDGVFEKVEIKPWAEYVSTFKIF